MTDLHSHILPEIDDGANSVDESIDMLKMELEQGVDSIVFTPHFDIRDITLDSFFEKREKSFNLLCNHSEFSKLPVSVKKGSEVFFSAELVDTDLSELCIEGTDYVLIELPCLEEPCNLRRAFATIVNNGFTPIIAHVERYLYITQSPDLLYDLVSDGCLAQVNAFSIINDSGYAKLICKFIKWGLVHFISSDCHSVGKRCPNTASAYQYIEEKLGIEYSNWIKENSDKIFNGKYVNLPVIYKPKKFFGIWK